MPSALTGTARVDALRSIPDWQEVPGRDAILRRFQFRDFSAAWAFMSRVALLAERLDHHPEWTNVYNRVEITLTTHDTGGLSTLDLDMARRIDAIVAEAGRPS